VRVEQLYPLHKELAKAIDDGYPKTAKRVWVQEEPRNQGAFLYIADAFREQLGINLAYVGRPASASPATGSEYTHKDQQEEILSAAVAPLPAGKDAQKGAPVGAGKH
jgi:2-oxoglutarate dehydrogenase E1 component